MRIAFWHFSRGMAFAGKKNLADAQTELDALRADAAAINVAAANGFTNSSSDLLGLAQDVLGAKIDEQNGAWAAAIAKLESGVRRQDGFLYIEPPDWYYPVRESLGAALLHSGDAAHAAQVFRDDLSRNPRNPRSLYGLAQSLKAMGRATEAALVSEQFRQGWQWADVQLAADDL